MSVKIRPPEERECELCGRRDVWDDDVKEWTIVTEGGERKSGNPYCIHEWDINGTHNPIRQ